MPQSIDWPGIRAAAVAIGVREAARRAAANLPAIEQQRFVNRVLQRSKRETWLAVKSQTPSVTGAVAKPMSSPVITGSESLQNKLQADNDATKTALATAARRGAQHLADAEPGAIVKSHHALRNITAAGSQLHGWEAKSGPSANVMVNIALLGVEPSSVTVQGEIVERDSDLT